MHFTIIQSNGLSISKQLDVDPAEIDSFNFIPNDGPDSTSLLIGAGPNQVLCTRNRHAKVYYEQQHTPKRARAWVCTVRLSSPIN